MTKLGIGIIGLSAMGRSLVLNMADHRFKVGGYNRSAAVTQQVMRDHPHENLTPFYGLSRLTNVLSRPRKAMLMIQAGKPMGAVIEQLVPLLEEESMILDGGNSFFEDTRRRAALLAEKGIHYLGVGISRGEEDARFGPSIMPGGNAGVYESVRPIPGAIIARIMNEPCCSYIGPDGAGHYVKVVHNEIEYADMQLITESYLLLECVGGFTNQKLIHIFESWGDGKLRSYLIGITAGIFQEADDLADGKLINRVRDSAKQKGIGRQVSIEALKQGVGISTITSARTTRIMSSHLDERERAWELIHSPTVSLSPDKETLAVMVHEALYTGRTVAYAQGFSLVQDASRLYGWNLDLGKVASIFRAGCIIQAIFLNDITRAFEAGPKPEGLIFDRFFLSHINEYRDSLRQAISTGVVNGPPIPILCNTVPYLDESRAKAAGANLIQAQRDCLGTHIYERTDHKSVLHHEWGWVNDNQH